MTLTKKSAVKPDNGKSFVDGGWGWVIAFGGGIVMFIQRGFISSFTLMFEELLTRFGHSAAATSWVYSIHSMTMMITAPFAAAMTNRYSCRLVTIAGGSLYFTGAVLTAFAPRLNYVYATYGLLAGMGFGMASTSGAIIVNQYFYKKRSKAMSLVSVMNSFGAIALVPLVNFMFEFYGYRGTLILIGSIASHICIAGHLFRPAPILATPPHKLIYIDTKTSTKTEPLLPDEEGICPTVKVLPTDDVSLSVKTVVDGDMRKNEQLLDEKFVKRQNVFAKVGIARFAKSASAYFDLILLRRPTFVAYCLLMCSFSFAASTSVVVMAGFAAEHGFTHTQIATLIMISAAMGITVRLASGVVFDHRLVRPHRPTIFGVVLMMIGTLHTAMPFARGRTSFGAVMLLNGFVSSLVAAQETVVVADVSGPDHIAGGVGLSRLFRAVGIICGPTMAGFIKDTYGSYSMAYYITGPAMGFCAIIFELTLRFYKNSSDTDIHDGR